jgi:signal transduction histidine kinase/CheY-like chemotaxis protein
MSDATLPRTAWRTPLTRSVAIGVAAALLLASLGLAVFSERAARQEILRETQVQAEILAATVAAPLAFDDTTATQEYVNALAANPAIEAAAAYSGDGALAAALKRGGDPPPAHAPARMARVGGGHVLVAVPVVQGTTRLGAVYLRVSTEAPLQRIMRYFGIGVVVVMASLLVATLGVSEARTREAHKRLQAEIREREKAEEALRQSQKMEAMGQLTGGVAHDFNNLLMVASSGLELMERTSDPQRRARLAQGMREAIDRGASLTQQLLAFSRKTPLKIEVVDLKAQVDRMRDVLDRSLREDIQVEVVAAADLWAVELDPAQFEVALLNIAINARDAMPRGGTIRIAIENLWADGDEAKDLVRVAISDEGEGMEPELLSRVFEPFFTTKKVGQGTGLGLSQVYGFARASGGETRIDSEVGRGTTVSLLLPRSAKPLPRREVAAPARTGQPGEARRVLLVEDDDRVAELVQEMLIELGYHVERVANASSALSALQDGADPDIVFSDMVMPGEMSGLDLARRVAEGWPGLPIVLTTGYSASAAAATSEGLRLLFKPYAMDALAAELGAAIHGQAQTAAE